MDKKYLTLEQNLCAARIFLNTFGFTLENVSNINEFLKIKIFDKTLNTVGYSCFVNGKVMMTAKYSNSILKASYDIAQVSGFVDMECGNALFGQWFSKITFEIYNNNIVSLNGTFLITNTIDSEFGISCFCHPLINYKISEKENITLKILRDGKFFDFEFNTDNYYEKIEIKPWDDGYILHDIKEGQYDNTKYCHPYRRYAGIFRGAERGENKDKLHIFLKEEKYNNILTFHDEYAQKVNLSNPSETVIQKGLLMQKLDADMNKKINQLRKSLLIDDIPLFDNLISVCYDDYTDEELSALFGIKREKMNYQDGSDNLVTSYYGIGINNQFLSLEEQKKLLKK